MKSELQRLTFQTFFNLKNKLLQTILYKNTKISYTDSGKGTVVVFLHGFLENKAMWNHYVAEYTTKYRVITVDLLGHGNSENLGYVHSMEENAKVVQTILTHLRIRKSILVGHSMGGYVGLAFAELFPDNVRSLILINSSASADSEERKLNRDRAIRAVKYNHDAFIRMAVTNLFSLENQHKLKNEIEHVKEQALKTSLQGIVATLEGMKIRKDREVLLHFGPYPISLILGIQDTVLNHANTATQVEGTRAILFSFPDGHMTPIENRDELCELLLQYFKKL